MYSSKYYTPTPINPFDKNSTNTHTHLTTRSSLHLFEIKYLSLTYISHATVTCTEAVSLPGMTKAARTRTTGSGIEQRAFQTLNGTDWKIDYIEPKLED